jgi:hypothetical protein
MSMVDKNKRHAELLEHLLRYDMNKARFEELAEARVVIGDIALYASIVVPVTNDGHVCPFMVGRLHPSLPIPTLALESAGLRRFGKKYIFTAVCGEDGVVTDEALYNALTGAFVEASTEGVDVLAVPTFGAMAGFLATMEAALRSFEDLTEGIGIQMPEVVLVADEADTRGV